MSRVARHGAVFAPGSLSAHNARYSASESHVARRWSRPPGSAVDVGRMSQMDWRLIPRERAVGRRVSDTRYTQSMPPTDNIGTSTVTEHLLGEGIAGRFAPALSIRQPQQLGVNEPRDLAGDVGLAQDSQQARRARAQPDRQLRGERQRLRSPQQGAELAPDRGTHLRRQRRPARVRGAVEREAQRGTQRLEMAAPRSGGRADQGGTLWGPRRVRENCGTQGLLSGIVVLP